MIRLNLLNVGMVEETGDILVILQAPQAHRLLVIETGLLEGQAIALEAEGVRSERPLTQDLLFETITRLGARVKEARIAEFRDETFFAKVVLTRLDGTADAVEIDARPSDAIALALRARAPILVNPDVLKETGIDEDRSGRFAPLYDDDDDDDDEDGDGGERIVH